MIMNANLQTFMRRSSLRRCCFVSSSNTTIDYKKRSNHHHHPTSFSSFIEQDAKVADDHLISPFWSLRALANMQKVEKNIVLPATSTTTTRTSSFGSAAGHHRQTSICHDVAIVLVNEVKYRLALQYKLCVQMNHYASTNGPMDDKKTTNNNNKKKKRIIRAVNAPVVNTPTKLLLNQIRIKKSVVTILNDMQRLHVDTHRLMHNITSSVILERFSNPDRFAVVSAMEQIQARHANTIENLTDIILNLRQLAEQEEKETMTSWLEELFLDPFLYERFRILLLCDHYIALDRHIPNHPHSSNNNNNNNNNNEQSSMKKRGVVHLHCPIIDLLQDAISEASHLCDANLGVAPDIVIIDDETNPINIPSVVRSNVHYALVELLKNAMASSVERHQKKSSKDNTQQCPSKIYIQTIIPSDHNVIECQIIDQGIGISSSQTLNNAWKFASSGADMERWDRLNEQQSYAMVRSPLQSLGVGLTLSRMMMRMFGGDITLTSRQQKTILYDKRSKSNNSGDEDISGANEIYLDSGCTATLTLSKDDLYIMK